MADPIISPELQRELDKAGEAVDAARDRFHALCDALLAEGLPATRKERRNAVEMLRRWGVRYARIDGEYDVLRYRAGKKHYVGGVKIWELADAVSDFHDAMFRSPKKRDAYSLILTFVAHSVDMLIFYLDGTRHAGGAKGKANAAAEETATHESAA